MPGLSLDAANGVDRFAGDTPAARLESYMAAERQAVVGAFLTFKIEPRLNMYMATVLHVLR